MASLRDPATKASGLLDERGRFIDAQFLKWLRANGGGHIADLLTSGDVPGAYAANLTVWLARYTSEA
jgi:hypothetical protein